MDEVVVRRARPRDAEDMAELINRARQREQKVTRTQVLEDLGGRGYLLAEVAGELHGVVGWHAEDLIARIQEAVVYPARLDDKVGRALIETVCQSAGDLMCEVALLFVSANASDQALQFYQSCGFEEVDVDDLIPAWRRAAQQSRPAGTFVMLRKLRDQRVLRPM